MLRALGRSPNLDRMNKPVENTDMWHRLSDVLGSFGQRTGLAGSLANLFDPDNWLPGGRDAAFTLALIALAAKMAVADGLVTASEERAFRATVEIAHGHEEQVARLFDPRTVKPAILPAIR